MTKMKTKIYMVRELSEGIWVNVKAFKNRDEGPNSALAFIEAKEAKEKDRLGKVVTEYSIQHMSLEG
jgi:hypothetical protein